MSLCAQSGSQKEADSSKILGVWSRATIPVPHRWMPPMWEILFHLIEPIVRLFGIAWCEDERPGARWFSVGCLVIALGLIGLVVLFVAS